MEMRLSLSMTIAGWLGYLTSVCAATEVTAAMLDQVQMGMTSTQVHDLLNVPLKNDCTPLHLGKPYYSAEVCISEKGRVYRVFSVEEFPASTDPYRLLDDVIKQEEAKLGPPQEVSEWTFNRQKRALWGSYSSQCVQITVLFSGSVWDNDDVYLQKSRFDFKIVQEDNLPSDFDLKTIIKKEK